MGWSTEAGGTSFEESIRARVTIGRGAGREKQNELSKQTRSRKLRIRNMVRFVRKERHEGQPSRKGNDETMAFHISVQFCMSA